MGELRVSLGAEDPGTATPVGYVAFDNLRGVPAAAEGWCPAESFTDDFEDGVVSHSWWVRSWDNAECSFAEQDGELQFNLTGAALYNCGVVLAPGYDMTGSSVTIEVPALTPGQPELNVWLEAFVDEDNAVSVGVHDGSVTFGYKLAGASYTPASASYSPSTHRWWRLREAGGETYWETSPDGSSWTVGLQVASPIDLSAINVMLAAECWDGCSAPVAVSFDNYNRPPSR
jgi:hypothetical protein